MLCLNLDIDMEIEIMKNTIKNVLIISAVILLWELFYIPPKNIHTPSKNIRQSKRLNAFVGKCDIIRVDTFLEGYTFPIERIWVEKIWILERNRFGIVIPIVKNTKIFRFDLNTKDPFFKFNFLTGWIIRDSLAGLAGLSCSLPTGKYRYSAGDTAVFEIQKFKNDDTTYYKKGRDIELVFKIYAVCNWQ